MNIISKTKNSLMASVFASAMLFTTLAVGGTFAWFTSQAKNEGNKIQAGTLEVQLWADDEELGWIDLSQVNKPIFDLENLEPSDVYEKTLRIVNSGTLDVQYNLSLENLMEDEKLQEVLDVYVDGVWKAPLDRFQNSGSLMSGTLEAETSVDVEIKIIFYSEAGNEYQGEEISPFDVLLFATQLSNSMTVNNVNAVGVVRKSTEYVTATTDTTTFEAGYAVATLPTETIVGVLGEAEVVSGNIEFSATIVSDNNENFVIGEDTEIAVLDLSLKVSGQQVTAFGDTQGIPNEIQITQMIKKGLPAVKVVYYALDGTPEVLRSTYDEVTGRLDFWTTHFSQFVVEAGYKTVKTADALQTIISNAPAGEVLYLEKGTHTLLNSITMSKDLTIVGEDGAIIDFFNFLIKAVVNFKNIVIESSCTSASIQLMANGNLTFERTTIKYNYVAIETAMGFNGFKATNSVFEYSGYINIDIDPAKDIGLSRYGHAPVVIGEGNTFNHGVIVDYASYDSIEAAEIARLEELTLPSNWERVITADPILEGAPYIVVWNLKK